MAEYMEKLADKLIGKLKIGGADKPKPAKEKLPEEELADDIPPEDPDAYHSHL